MKLENKAAVVAIASMTQNVAARLEVKKKNGKCGTCISIYVSECTAVEIPESLLKQMTTCQTAGNEFLRQFWSAVYPPASDLQTLATASPMHKAAKIDRMADYLSRTPVKVDALVQMARQESVDPVRVQVVRQYFTQVLFTSLTVLAGVATITRCCRQGSPFLSYTQAAPLT